MSFVQDIFVKEPSNILLLLALLVVFVLVVFWQRYHYSKLLADEREKARKEIKKVQTVSFMAGYVHHLLERDYVLYSSTGRADVDGIIGMLHDGLGYSIADLKNGLFKHNLINFVETMLTVFIRCAEFSNSGELDKAVEDCRLSPEQSSAVMTLRQLLRYAYIMNK